jgi:hypothetical protein
MREHGAIICGSFAVQFFDRDFYENSNLDIFVQSGDTAENLETHLMTAEGYLFAYMRAGPQFIEAEPDLE